MNPAMLLLLTLASAVTESIAWLKRNILGTK